MRWYCWCLSRSLCIFHPPSLPSLHLLTCVRVSFLSSPPQANPATKGAAAKNPDAKWHAVVQLAVTALDEAGGDLEHIGESSVLQDALLAALKRARLPAYKKLLADIMNDRSVAIDLLNASTWSFASPPVTNCRCLHHSRRRRSAHGFARSPARPCSSSRCVRLRQALCAREHGTGTRTAAWLPNPPTTSLAFGGAARRS